MQKTKHISCFFDKKDVSSLPKYSKMQQKKYHNKRIECLVTLLGAAALLLFFLFLYPYHLRHREQTMLFLSNTDWIRENYLSLNEGGFVRMVGDFLQQFFYYIGAGPVIVTILVTLLGILWYKIVERIGDIFSSQKADSTDNAFGWRIAAFIVAAIAMIWEAGRECQSEYPVASTVQALGWSSILLLALQCGTRRMRLATLGLGVIAGCWLFDYHMLPHSKLFGKPNFITEHQMALDVEASFGNWNKIEQLTEEEIDSNLDIYYHNLALAQQNRLPEAMMTRLQNGGDGLFIPVNEEGNYFLFAAAGEAWWAVNDMTMAEHATLLGLIFSPRKTGSRCLKRLAEINLAKGDQEGANKYLRLLEQSIVHGSWASKIKDGTLPVKKSPLVVNDTLRLQGETRLCLRNMLDAQPDNTIARQYLLCYDLLYRDLLSFTDDVQRYGCPREVRLYEEAMLVVMSSRPELRETWQPMVRRQTFAEFEQFNQALIQSQGKLNEIKPKFGKTYWYYLRHK